LLGHGEYFKTKTSKKYKKKPIKLSLKKTIEKKKKKIKIIVRKNQTKLHDVTSKYKRQHDNEAKQLQ
jgi:hypothetical protein